jgi:hypothetical protein
MGLFLPKSGMAIASSSESFEDDIPFRHRFK